MLEQVEVAPRSLAAYRGIAPEAVLEDLVRVASELHGARVLHVNATPYGGGVSELLRSGIPLLNDLGLVAHWKIIRGGEPSFAVTKKLHNGLQGAKARLSEHERAAYLETSLENAAQLEEEYDFVLLHDPQPAPIVALRGKGGARWIWRCHIDTQAPDPDTWEVVRPHVAAFDAAIFTMREFVPNDLPVSRVEIVPPAIDPLSPKNMPLPDETARRILDWIGVPLDRPLVTQVSRFDPWEDPLGVIEAFRLARNEVPDLQLALVGSMALDDPEAWGLYRDVKAERGNDPSIHLFTNLTGVGNLEMNAFQRLSALVVQKSLREGFGLVVSEALWKGTPLVAGRAGGIPLQMADGSGGLLVDSVDECAAALVELLTQRERADELARSGQERVRQLFLPPRLLLDELTLMRALATERPIGRDASWFTSHDPVCGMSVARPGEAVSEVAVAGRVFRFCSEACRRQFAAAPEHHIGKLTPGGAP